MLPLHSFSHFIISAISTGALPSLAIILGVIFLEDTTVLIVGMLAADGIIPLSYGLFSVYAGIIIGDIGLYGLGYLASSHPKLARYVDHDFLAPFRTWIETRFILTIFTARFIPGARLPTYAASGFFRSPLSTFVTTAIGATAIWTTILFFSSYWFGNATTEWTSSARWGVVFVFVLTLFLIGRHNILAYKTKKDAVRTVDGTHAK